MTRRVRPVAAFVALALLAAGCSSSPEPAYYTLAASPGAPRAGGPRLVELRQPSIAGYLDRSELVRRDTGYKLDIRPGERWGEPFAAMVGRVLADDLNQRMPGATVFTAQGSLNPDPQATIDLDVLRFDLGSDGTVVLHAQVAVTRHGGAAQTRTIEVQVKPASGTTADLVAAMSRAAGQLADGVAGMLRAS